MPAAAIAAQSLGPDDMETSVDAHMVSTASPDVQHRLAGEFAVDQAAGDCADLVPGCLDRDLRRYFPGRDQLREEAQPDAGALDAHQLVEEGEAVEPSAAGAEKLPAFDG